MRRAGAAHAQPAQPRAALRRRQARRRVSHPAHRPDSGRARAVMPKADGSWAQGTRPRPLTARRRNARPGPDRPGSRQGPGSGPPPTSGCRQHRQTPWPPLAAATWHPQNAGLGRGHQGPDPDGPETRSCQQAQTAAQVACPPQRDANDHRDQHGSMIRTRPDTHAQLAQTVAWPGLQGAVTAVRDQAPTSVNRANTVCAAACERLRLTATEVRLCRMRARCADSQCNSAGHSVHVSVLEIRSR